MIARISDSRTWIDVVNEKDCGMGVFVDIYQLTKLEIKTMMRLLRQWNMLDLITLLYFLLPENIIIRGIQGIIKNLIKFPAFYLYSYSWSKIFCQENKQIT